MSNLCLFLGRRAASTVLAAMLLTALSLVCPFEASAQNAHEIVLRADNPSEVSLYNRFEARFTFKTNALNTFLPYDAAPPEGVPAGVGVTVNAQLLPPDSRGNAQPDRENNWKAALVQPCFLYQPMDDTGGDLVPRGSPLWMLRYNADRSDRVGIWRYRIRVTDAQGTSTSPSATFTCKSATTARGFVGVSPKAPEQFEFQDGTAFPHPLVNAEALWRTLAEQRTRIPQIGQAGVRYVRWWLTARGANFCFPFGGEVRPAWAFSGELSTNAGPETGSRFSWAVTNPYSRQTVPLLTGVTYRLTVRARVEGGAWLRLQLRSDAAGAPGVEKVVTGTDGKWEEQALVFAPASGTTLTVGINRPEGSTGGTALFSDARLQVSRDGGATFEPGNWLTHGSADTHLYVDQRDAARADDVFALSETHNVYHKITLLDMDCEILGRIAGGATTAAKSDNNVYAAEGTAGRWYQQAWWRYVIARWTPYRSVQSLEFANEIDPYNGTARDAVLAFAGYIKRNCPRNPMPVTSFWHSFNRGFWSNALLDYGDIHEYIGPSVPGTVSFGNIFWWGLARRGPSPIWLEDGSQRVEIAYDETNRNRVLKLTCSQTGQSRSIDIAYFGGVPGRTYRVKARSRGVNLQNNPANTWEGTSLNLFASNGYTSENDVGSSGGWQPGIKFRCGVPPEYSSEVVTVDQWTEYTSEEMVMNPAKEVLGLRLQTLSVAGMTIWYDDIRVEEKDSSGNWTLVWRTDFDEPLVTDDSALDVRAYWFKFAGFRLGKPIVRGETGLQGYQNYGSPVSFNGQSYPYTGEEQDLVYDTAGVYYKKKIWAHLGCPGFYDGQWWTDNLDKKNLWGLYGAYEKFLAGERITDGTWRPVGSDLDGDRWISATGGVRVWGRRSGNRSLLWIDNPDSRWTKVVADRVTPLTGTVSITGLSSGTYAVEWWNTFTGAITKTESQRIRGGTLSLSLDKLAGDVAVKVYLK